MTHNRVIVVEGIIGSGKSAFCDMLGTELDYLAGSSRQTLVLQEPDERGDANPYLADYYKDPPRWALAMQVHLLQARFRMQLQAQFHAMQGMGDAVLDRSYYGDVCFARLQVRDGFMSDREMRTYASLYEGMTCFVRLPSVCVRLLVAPEIANERIQRRAAEREGRRSELGIPVGYLERLDEEITKMVAELRAGGVQVYDLAWDEDRPTEDRRRAVKALAQRIVALKATDQMLTMHRRCM